MRLFSSTFAIALMYSIDKKKKKHVHLFVHSSVELLSEERIDNDKSFIEGRNFLTSTTIDFEIRKIVFDLENCLTLLKFVFY